MKLNPLPFLDLRRKKTLDHYYRAIERWWELSNQPVETWRLCRKDLDAAALDGIEREELRDGILDEAVSSILDAGHDHWFLTTQHECDGADEYPHEISQRYYLVSRRGVIVVLAKSAGRPTLVTAFRPDPVAPNNPDFPRAAKNYVHRCAVRRMQRQTSYRR